MNPRFSRVKNKKCVVKIIMHGKEKRGILYIMDVLIFDVYSIYDFLIPSIDKPISK